MIEVETAQLAALIAQLTQLNALLSAQRRAEDPQFYMAQISASMPWVVDYKGRKHIYVLSSIALALTSTDIGTINVATGGWNYLDLEPGQRVYAAAQTNPVYLYVMCTDEIVPSSVTGSVAISNANPNGQATMNNSSPVVLASNQTWGTGIGSGTDQPFTNFLPVSMGLVDFTAGINPWYSAGANSRIGTGGAFNAAVASWLATGSSLFDAERTPAIWKPIKAQAITAGTPVSVWTPVGGKKFNVMGFMLSLTVAGSIIFEDATGSSNEFLRTPTLLAATPFISPFMLNGYLSTTANNQLFLDVTASGSVSGLIYGTEQ